VLRDHVQVSLPTYKKMLEHFNIGEPHITLVGGEKWYPPEARKGLLDAAMDELRRLGFVRGDRLDADWADTVAVLQRPGTEYYTWAKINGRSITVRTACSGREGVIAVANEDTLFLWPSNPDTAPQDLAAQLPDTPPAHLHSMSCAEADYQALATGRVPPESGGRDAKQILRWLKAPRVHAGQLYAAVRDGRGTRRRTTRPPFWIDTESGRIMASVDANGWLSVSAAGAHDVATRLRRLEAELRGR
jgi:hypothetical protein